MIAQIPRAKKNKPPMMSPRLLMMTPETIVCLPIFYITWQVAYEIRTLLSTFW